MNPGDILLGKYRIEKCLGSGAMGTVYKAIEIALERPVALKFIKKELHDENPSAKSIFTDEAIAQAKLDHENVVKIYGHDWVDGEPCLVMELVSGGSLKSRLLREGKMAELDAIGVIAQAAKGLRAIHSQQVIHRDLKPSNLLVSASGVVKVSDFGIAKILDEATLERSNLVWGAAWFLSPEQKLGLRHTVQNSDVYSLGATFLKLVTWDPEETPLRPDELLERVMRGQTRNGVRLQRETGELLRKMLAMEAEARPSAVDLVEELARILERLESASGDTATLPPSPTPPPEVDTQREEDARRVRRTYRIGLGVLGIILLLAIVGMSLLPMGGSASKIESPLPRLDSPVLAEEAPSSQSSRPSLPAGPQVPPASVVHVSQAAAPAIHVHPEPAAAIAAQVPESPPATSSTPQPLTLGFALVVYRNGQAIPIRDGGTLRLGDKFWIQVQPSKDCWLYVFSRDSHGKGGCLFPHPSFSSGNPVGAAATIILPAAADDKTLYSVSELSEEEDIFLVATTDRDPVLEEVASKVPLEVKRERQGMEGEGAQLEKIDKGSSAKDRVQAQLEVRGLSVVQLEHPVVRNSSFKAPPKLPSLGEVLGLAITNGSTREAFYSLRFQVTE